MIKLEKIRLTAPLPGLIQGDYQSHLKSEGGTELWHCGSFVLAIVGDKEIILPYGSAVLGAIVEAGWSVYEGESPRKAPDVVVQDAEFEEVNEDGLVRAGLDRALPVVPLSAWRNADLREKAASLGIDLPNHFVKKSKLVSMIDEKMNDLGENSGQG